MSRAGDFQLFRIYSLPTATVPLYRVNEVKKATAGHQNQAPYPAYLTRLPILGNAGVSLMKHGKFGSIPKENSIIGTCTLWSVIRVRQIRRTCETNGCFSTSFNDPARSFDIIRVYQYHYYQKSVVDAVSEARFSSIYSCSREQRFILSVHSFKIHQLKHRSSTQATVFNSSNNHPLKQRS